MLRYFDVGNYPPSFCLGWDERPQLVFGSLDLAICLPGLRGRATRFDSMKKAHAAAAVKHRVGERNRSIGKGGEIG